MTIYKSLVCVLISAVCASAIGDDFFDTLRKTSSSVKKDLRTEYLTAIDEGRRPSVESILGYKMELDFKQNGTITWLDGRNRYFIDVLPYFYQNPTWYGEEFVWDEVSIKLVKEQVKQCEYSKNRLEQAQARFIVDLKTAKVNPRNGELVFPEQSHDFLQQKKKSIVADCYGVSPAFGDFVVQAMQKGAGKEIKGGF